MQIQYRSQLPELMKYFNLPMVAVEIGVAEGLFSRDLLNSGLVLYSIDNWGHLDQRGDGGNDDDWHNKNYNEAKERLKQFGEKSIMLRGLSSEMHTHIPDNSCGLVYVDCDHSYESVKADIENYWPKLVEGGIMGLHDFDNVAYGVNQAVTEFAGKYNLEVHHIPENQPEDAGAYIIKP